MNAPFHNDNSMHLYIYSVSTYLPTCVRTYSLFIIAETMETALRWGIFCGLRKYTHQLLYQSFTAHQHQKGHTVPKQVTPLDDDDDITESTK